MSLQQVKHILQWSLTLLQLSQLHARLYPRKVFMGQCWYISYYQFLVNCILVMHFKLYWLWWPQCTWALRFYEDTEILKVVNFWKWFCLRHGIPNDKHVLWFFELLLWDWASWGKCIETFLYVHFYFNGNFNIVHRIQYICPKLVKWNIETNVLFVILYTEQF